MTLDTNGKVTTSQLEITNEIQEVSSLPAGDHNASINRRARNLMPDLEPDILSLSDYISERIIRKKNDFEKQISRRQST